MTTDDDDGAPEATATAQVDRAELEAMLREILPGFLSELTPETPAAGDPPEPDDNLDRPATVRDLEAWSEKTMAEAMKILRAAKPAAKPAPTTKPDAEKPDPEPAPVSGPMDLRGRMQKLLFGDLSK